MALLSALERLRSPCALPPQIPDALLVTVRHRAGAAMENTLEALQTQYDTLYPDGYRLVAYQGDGQSTCLTPLFAGLRQRGRILAVYKNKELLTGITHLASFFKGRHFCVDCRTSYHIPHKHSNDCHTKCVLCQRVGPFMPCVESPAYSVECTHCLTVFHNPSCYAAHFKNACKWYKKCPHCLKRFCLLKKSSHLCLKAGYSVSL